MKFYPSDWLADCGELSVGARGAWHSFLCKAWLMRSASVTLKAAQWSRMFGATNAEHAERLIAEIEECGIGEVVRDNEGKVTLTSRRIARDLDAMTTTKEARAEAARIAANTRWEKERMRSASESNAERNANAMPNDAIPESILQNINTTPIGNGKYANENKPKIQQPPIDGTKPKITFFGLPEVTETTKELLGEAMRKINELYPPWSKRPHWTRAEMEKLLANIGFISDITDRDWKLLGFYLRSKIPPEFKKCEGDFWQPDHRGALVEHISGVLSNADRLLAECRRKGWKLPDELK